VLCCIVAVRVRAALGAASDGLVHVQPHRVHGEPAVVNATAYSAAPADSGHVGVNTGPPLPPRDDTYPDTAAGAMAL